MSVVPLPTLRALERDEQLGRLIDAAIEAIANDRPDVAIGELVAAVKVARGHREVPAEIRVKLDQLMRAGGGHW